MILLGFGLPFVYLVSTVMLFNEPKKGPTIIVGACSVLCVAVGVWILIRNR